eukprot:TRINITY_DN2011_c0_g1_i1.p15 TRINITY_DN2011_c0_g1~~TRINITY_DN2011_c0_g1_i1.p15  ORF type:complete len:129 (-),score=19.33 TRINITY_DN2011_c0_g1_i1:5363-5749(-)
MRARVLFFLALLMGFSFIAAQEKAATQEAPKVEPEIKEEPAEEEADEDDKAASYFTQETLKELGKIDEFKNNRLWACHLLASCKLMAEQVLLLAFPTHLENFGWNHHQQRAGSVALRKDLFRPLVELL